MWRRFETLVMVLLVVAPAVACSHTTPYRDVGIAVPADRPVESLAYRILLVGDAGGPRPNEPTLAAARDWAEEFPDRTLVAFLGDNAYPDGLTSANRSDAQRRLVQQLQVVGDTEATALFIPGNHDWASGGPEGFDAVLAQEEFLRGRARFLPSGGCPGPEVLDLPEAGPRVRIVVLDTQWWLHDRNKPTDRCASGTAAAVEERLRDAIDTDLAVVVMAHHPLVTHGPHGGFFDWRDHIFPLRRIAPWLWVPLPGVGSVYPLVRWHVVRSDQGLSGADNQEMRDALSRALATRADRGVVLYVAGHEHSLQVLRGDVVDYVLVSGAGSQEKITPVGSGPDTLFAHENTGFMALDLVQNAMWVSVVEPTASGESEVVFSLAIPDR